MSYIVLQQVNTEEELLEFEATQFPILQTMIAYKEPYDKLWRTALSSTTKMKLGLMVRYNILLGNKILINEMTCKQCLQKV